MTEAPKVIWARPVVATKSWDEVVSGPWPMENPYGTSIRYIRADAPELLAYARAVEAWEADVILNADWAHDTPRLTQGQWDELIRMHGCAIPPSPNGRT